MSYVAIYREFRPQRFEDVIGQEHVTETLKRQVQSNRIAHAYLFSGGRGSGKTSTAKILSRVVNCLHPVNGEPCNECEICKAALEGSLTDVTEIDAASNNGVDNIRDIREEVEFLPTTAKYRVYIIDEVHMLSTGAFNALLKTLEEPPAHVIFILATTEPQKLPVTILSRCQRFDFKRISIENICKTLRKCVEKLGITVSDDALNLIARMSDGAMRDAYSLLDRCIADGESEITQTKVKELIGIPEFEYLKTFAELLTTGNAEKLIEFAEQIISEGKNLEVFLAESIKFLRDILIYKVSNILEGFNESETQEIKSLAEATSGKLLISAITKLSSVQSDMKWSNDVDVAFETGILRVTVEVFGTGQSVVNSPLPNNIINNAVDKNSNDMPKIDVSNVNKDLSLKEKVLIKLKENHKMRISAVLMNAEIIEASEELIHIVFNSATDETKKAYMQQDETKRAIKEAVISATQKDFKVKYVFNK